jgi:hypothetical protein
MRLFSGLFWGIFLLASGVIILLKVSLNLQVSSPKLIFGLFVLMIGVSLLTSNFGWDNFNGKNSNTTAFTGGQQTMAEDGKEYYVVFGSTNYDLTDLEPGEHVKINCAFGYCKVILPAGAVQVKTSCAFGNIHLPDGSNTPFGSGAYSHPGDNGALVEITCAFGGITVSN